MFIPELDRIGIGLGIVHLGIVIGHFVIGIGLFGTGIDHAQWAISSFAWNHLIWQDVKSIKV